MSLSHGLPFIFIHIRLLLVLVGGDVLLVACHRLLWVVYRRQTHYHPDCAAVLQHVFVPSIFCGRPSTPCGISGRIDRRGGASVGHTTEEEGRSAQQEKVLGVFCLYFTHAPSAVLAFVSFYRQKGNKDEGVPLPFYHVHCCYYIIIVTDPGWWPRTVVMTMEPWSAMNDAVRTTAVCGHHHRGQSSSGDAAVRGPHRGHYYCGSDRGDDHMARGHDRGPSFQTSYHNTAVCST